MLLLEGAGGSYIPRRNGQLGPYSGMPLVVTRTSRGSSFAYSGATGARGRNLIKSYRKSF